MDKSHNVFTLCDLSSFRTRFNFRSVYLYNFNDFDNFISLNVQFLSLTCHLVSRLVLSLICLKFDSFEIYISHIIEKLFFSQNLIHILSSKFNEIQRIFKVKIEFNYILTLFTIIVN